MSGNDSSAQFCAVTIWIEMTSNYSKNTSEFGMWLPTNERKCCKDLCGQIDEIIHAAKRCYEREHIGENEDMEHDSDTFFDQMTRSIHGTIWDYFKQERIQERVKIAHLPSNEQFLTP